MSYLKKDAVLAAIKSRDLEHDGEKYTIFEAYLGTDPYSKKPIRKAAKSEPKLKRKIEEFYKKLSAGGDYAVLLSADESTDARKAIDMLKSRKIDISLTECVRKFIEGGNSLSTCTTKLSDAYAKYLDSQDGKSDGHIKAVRSRVGTWVTLFGGDRLLNEVSPKEVADSLESRFFDKKTEEQKTTYNNHLGYIKSFMSWCTYPEQGFIAKNPLESMKLKPKKWRDVEYLKVEDCDALFHHLEGREEYETDLADSILSFFCGMRQAEIERVRLGPSAVVINLDEKFIRVIACKGATKGIQPRVFTIPDTAFKWMKSFPFMAAVMQPNAKFREHLRKISDEAHIKRLPKNCGRHTFCTMFDAAFHDQVQLTAIAGNSEDIRARHYNGLATEKEGRRFFAILPSSGNCLSNQST